MALFGMRTVWPSGGPVDLIARLIAQRLSRDLGQPFTVENIPAGGGNVGVSVVARATPAAAGTTTRTGRAGYVCARAIRGRAESAAAPADPCTQDDRRRCVVPDTRDPGVSGWSPLRSGRCVLPGIAPRLRSQSGRILLGVCPPCLMTADLSFRALFRPAGSG
jgi:Tripartite tricarboxylate transporter family receptor